MYKSRLDLECCVSNTTVMFFQGLKAVHSPHTGIIDYKVVTQSYGQTFEKLGGHILTDFEVTGFSVTKESGHGIDYPVTIRGTRADKVLL